MYCTISGSWKTGLSAPATRCLTGPATTKVTLNLKATSKRNKTRSEVHKTRWRLESHGVWQLTRVRKWIFRGLRVLEGYPKAEVVGIWKEEENGCKYRALFKHRLSLLSRKTWKTMHQAPFDSFFKPRIEETSGEKKEKKKEIIFYLGKQKPNRKGVSEISMPCICFECNPPESFQGSLWMDGSGVVPPGGLWASGLWWRRCQKPCVNIEKGYSSSCVTTVDPCPWKIFPSIEWK